MKKIKYNIHELNRSISPVNVRLMTRNEDLEECYSIFKKDYPELEISRETYEDVYYCSKMSSKGNVDMAHKDCVGRILHIKIVNWEWDESGDNVIIYYKGNESKGEKSDEISRCRCRNKKATKADCYQ